MAVHSTCFPGTPRLPPLGRLLEPPARRDCQGLSLLASSCSYFHSRGGKARQPWSVRIPGCPVFAPLDPPGSARGLLYPAEEVLGVMGRLGVNLHIQGDRANFTVLLSEP